MKCAWKELLAILPPNLRSEVDKYGKDSAQELRVRLGKPSELVTVNGSLWFGESVGEQDIRFTVNTASRYSPWAAETASKGFITAAGGHRIGLCGEAVTERGQARGIKTVTSLNIRIARDFCGIAPKLPGKGNLLILGPPGSGKTTMLRDLTRQIAGQDTVAVVDERSELFPSGFQTGKRMDILSGCAKAEGIDMVLRTMGPACIAVDEITAEEDCIALQKAGWCGVRLIATAHASCQEDLRRRAVYNSLWQTGLFDTLLILRPDKSWYTERMVSCC